MTAMDFNALWMLTTVLLSRENIARKATVRKHLTNSLRISTVSLRCCIDFSFTRLELSYTIPWVSYNLGAVLDATCKLRLDLSTMWKTMQPTSC